MTAQPHELNESFVRSLPDNGPVVMVNLVRFRERALDGSGSGRDSYLRYSQATMPIIKACGGAVLWAGDAEGAAFGDPSAKYWNYVVLVRYPSRAAFLRMVTSPEYAKADAHRENAVEDHAILPANQTYSK